MIDDHLLKKTLISNKHLHSITQYHGHTNFHLRLEEYVWVIKNAI